MSKFGDSAAPAPDPRIGDAAERQAQLGEDWLSFAKDSYGVSQQRQSEIDALTKQVTQAQLAEMERQGKISAEDRQRYETVFRPIEDQFVSEAQNYDTPERQAEAAANARADVQSSAEAERAAADRRAASVGINPSSGRYTGIDRGIGLGTAVAGVDAANKARQDVRDRGLALKTTAIDIGKGLPVSSNTAAALGLGAGTDALNAEAQANAQFQGSTGIIGQGYSGALSGVGSSANTLSSLYSANLNKYRTDQSTAADEASGWGSAIGTGLGLILSKKMAKTGKKPIADGVALDAVNKMPVESWRYRTGLGDTNRHVGPYAEDFKREAGSGDGQTIPAQDAIGITMKAVQDLDKKVTRMAMAVGLGGSRRAA